MSCCRLGQGGGQNATIVYHNPFNNGHLGERAPRPVLAGLICLTKDTCLGQKSQVKSTEDGVNNVADSTVGLQPPLVLYVLCCLVWDWIDVVALQ